MCTFAKSDDPNEMPHNAAFHLGLHCLLNTKPIFRKIQLFGEIITCDPTVYTMGHPGCIACSFVENSIDLKEYIYLLMIDVCIIN